MTRFAVYLQICACLLGSLATPIQGKESYSDIDASVADADAIVIGKVTVAADDGSVTMAVEKWLKGKPTPDGLITVKGETGFCITRGPVARYMKPGKRYFVFVFAGGKPGRLGQIIELGENGKLPETMYILFGDAKPATEADLVQLVADIQTKVPEQLIEQLQSNDAKTRATAVGRLGRLRVQSAYKQLLAIALDENAKEGGWDLRRTAFYAVGCLRNQEAVEPLLKFLASGRRADLEGTVASALGEIGGERVAPVLAKRLDELLRSNGDVNLRNNYIHALVQCGAYWTEDVQAVLAKVIRTTGGPAETLIQAASAIPARSLVCVFAQALGEKDAEIVENAARGVIWLSGFPAAKAAGPRLPEPEVITAAEKALRGRNVDFNGRTPIVRDLAQMGWLVEYPLPDTQPPQRGGSFFVLVMDRAGAEVLLIGR